MYNSEVLLFYLSIAILGYFVLLPHDYLEVNIVRLLENIYVYR